jgi:hypothetical protein
VIVVGNPNALGALLGQMDADIVASTGCTRCGAKAGEPCHGPKGRAIKKPHDDRYAVAAAKDPVMSAEIAGCPGVPEWLAHLKAQEPK